MDQWWNDPAELAGRYAGEVFRLAYARTGRRADSEDVMQEVFLRLLRARPAFRDGDHARAWLLRVASNCANDWFRAPWRRREAPLSDALPAPEAPRPGGALEAVLEKGYSMTAPVQVFAVSSDGSACIPEPEDRAHLADGQDVVLPGVSRENWDQVTDLWVSLSYKGPEEPIEGDWTLTLTARETAGVSTPADFSLDVSAGTTVTGVSLSPLGVVVEYTGQPGDLPPDAVEVALAGGSSPEWGETSAWNWGGEGYLIRRFAAPAEIEGASAALFGQTVPLA